MKDERSGGKDAEIAGKQALKISAGNDESDGDARDEERMDKDEDLKTGNDNDSPLAHDYTDTKYRITPAFFRSPDANKGHNTNNMDEQEERDPTETDTPDLSTE